MAENGSIYPLPGGLPLLLTLVGLAVRMLSLKQSSLIKPAGVTLGLLT